jgi:hypothetical protein
MLLLLLLQEVGVTKIVVVVVAVVVVVMSCCSTVGCKKLQEVGVTKILLEGMGKPEAAAEGATLGLWLYQEFKNKIKQKKVPHLEFYGEENEEERYIYLISFINPFLLDGFPIFSVTVEHILILGVCILFACMRLR